MFSLALTLAMMTQPASHPLPANELCPVTGMAVTNHMVYHHVTVQGRQYYVYDRVAAARLRNCPQCYLLPDGTPRNLGAGSPH